MPRPGKRISPHASRVAAALSSTTWQTSAEVAVLANVAPRTARAHLTEMVKSKTADVQETWPAITYRRRG